MRALLFSILVFTGTASAQWQMLDAHTTADLRGIESLSQGVAWASGSNGTVLRSEDGGLMWQICATPPGAEHLDFRGVQAFDNNIAVVMSSGPGDLSRLYETTDGCQTWKLVFSNPDPKGFWDALWVAPDSATLFVLGDPVDGRFRLFSAAIDAHTGKLQKFTRGSGAVILAAPGESAFAASNSLLAASGAEGFSFVTGGSRSEIVSASHGTGHETDFSRVPLPFASCASCGAFAVAAGPSWPGHKASVVVVGGDYAHPEDSSRTAAFGDPRGGRFRLSQSPPHGYRSAVGYDAAARAWITVGPNGTDISHDQGRSWSALKPGPGDAPDADQHWNALSLPYAVGPHGRIGMLQAAAARAAAAAK